MKTFTLFLVLLTLTLTDALSQSPQGTYKKIDYIHVEQDQLSSFMQLVKNDLTSAYQQLVDDQDLTNWALYHVEYPGGKKSSYNFVSIVSTPSISSIEETFSTVTSTDYIPSEAQSGNMPTVENSVIKTELWRVENALLDSSETQPTKFMGMDYMNVTSGKNPDYLMLEEEVAKPIHQARIQDDRMTSWQVYSLITPGGVEYGYNFATGNFYNKLEYLEYGFTNEVIKQSMGTKTNIPELFNTIYTTRDLVKSELWRLVAYTQ